MNAATMGSGGHFLQCNVASNWRNTVTRFVNKTTPTSFRATTLFQCLSDFRDGLQKRTLAVPKIYRADTLIAFCRQRLLRAWKKLLSESQFTNFSKAMAPCMLFDCSICQLQTLATRSEHLSALLQQKTLVYIGSPFKGGKSVDTASFDHYRNTDSVLQYVTYLFFDRLRSVVLNRNFHLEGK